jgi:hypothetical protein
MAIQRCCAIACLLGLVGCASTADLDRVLKPPAAAAKAATDVVTQSEQDVLKLVALGAVVYPGDAKLPALACEPAAGPDVATTNLATFTDALSAIDAVAAKPADSSYAAILGKIRDDDKAASKDYDEERQEIIKKRDAGRKRCAALLQSDLDAGTQVYLPPPDRGITSVAAAASTFALLDKLANSILAAIEQQKRDTAIRETVKALIPQLREAVASLETPVTDGFGPRISYAVAEGPAEKMNRTSLGAAVSLQRWWIAQIIEANWNALSRCRGSKPTKSCLKDVRDQAHASDLSTAVLQYRALALTDTDQVIASLHKSIDGADAAMSAKGLASLLDSLSQIGATLSTISSNVSGVEKALK